MTPDPVPNPTLSPTDSPRGTMLLDTEPKDFYLYVQSMDSMISKYGSIKNNDYENDKLNYDFVIFCKTCFNWEKCQSPSGGSLSYIPDRLDPGQSSLYCADCDRQALDRIKLADVKHLSKEFLDMNFITCVLFSKNTKIYRLKTVTSHKTSYQTTELLNMCDIANSAVNVFLEKRKSFKMP